MGRRAVTVTGTLAVVLCLSSCGPIYFPAIYHLERPLLLPPDQPTSMGAVGITASGGQDVNIDVDMRFASLGAAAGYHLSIVPRSLSLRGTALAYTGRIGREFVTGIAMLGEPALTIPLGSLGLSILGEVGGAAEFGPYTQRFRRTTWGVAGGGIGLTVHLSPRSHLVLDGRLYTIGAAVRAAYIDFPWSVYLGLKAPLAGSLGFGYLLGEEPRARRR